MTRCQPRTRLSQHIADTQRRTVLALTWQRLTLPAMLKPIGIHRRGELVIGYLAVALRRRRPNCTCSTSSSDNSRVCRLRNAASFSLDGSGGAAYSSGWLTTNYPPAAPCNRGGGYQGPGQPGSSCFCGLPSGASTAPWPLLMRFFAAESSSFF